MTTARSKLAWSDLSGAQVGVWGLGREGRASLRKLRALGVEPVLVDDAPRAKASGEDGQESVLATAAGGLDALKRCEVVIKTPGISPYTPAADELRAAGVTLAGGLGLWMNEADTARVVCVTGTGIRDDLFGSPEKTGREIVPIGEIIYINTQPFTIVGIFEHYESEQDKKERERLARELADRERVAAPVLTAEISAPPTVPPQPSSPLSGGALVKEIKKGLTQLGCYSGPIDDTWKSASTRSAPSAPKITGATTANSCSARPRR